MGTTWSLWLGMVADNLCMLLAAAGAVWVIGWGPWPWWRIPASVVVFCSLPFWAAFLWSAPFVLMGMLAVRRGAPSLDLELKTEADRTTFANAAFTYTAAALILVPIAIAGVGFVTIAMGASWGQVAILCGGSFAMLMTALLVGFYGIFRKLRAGRDLEQRLAAPVSDGVA